MQTLYNYLQIYLSRPTVVAMDVFLLFMGISVLVGVVLLSRKIDDLNVTISILKKRIGE